ncbi:hypothetical protein GGS23DRAFT_597687 [Durotheca rogersii]|uniref:uncharacterized protein n=1 Tax=Durotheca rogersii TaxID=419775 RepID=UPI00222114FC|nr:uncharacterized protein GGS23DRAFT_597687 [Durotheca rogersii]KAI5862471.1 hypothetical protein GGS23DRAFT_597687 [Durotheca rogersii]
MTSYAWKNKSSGYYDLSPTSYGVTQNIPPAVTTNLVYEITDWQYGLGVARQWEQRLGQRVKAEWMTVAARLAPPALVGRRYAVDARLAAHGGDGGASPPFMPGSTGFLYARNAPSFSKDGTWTVKHEGLLKTF